MSRPGPSPVLDFDPRMLFDLTGRTGIVTGGAGILGATFVEALLAHGANVVVADIDQDAAEALAARLDAAHGGRVAAVAFDAADPASVNELVRLTVERFAGIDFLINNHVAPVVDPGRFFAPFEDYDLSEWRRIMGINLDGYFLVAQAAGRQMAAQGRGGAIVQTSSIYGVMASDNRIYEGSEYRGYAINNPAIYSASKAGVVGLTRWLSTYWADRGIRVNAVAPGGVFSGENEAFTKRYSARIPMGRMAHRHEIAGTVVYLVADASSYVTGQCLMVDGGLSAW